MFEGAAQAGGAEVVGLDNLNDYYDPQLKKDRMAALAELYRRGPAPVVPEQPLTVAQPLDPVATAPSAESHPEADVQPTPADQERP